MKILIAVLILCFSFSCQSISPRFNFSNIIVNDKSIEYNITCKGGFQNGIKAQVLSNGEVLFEKELSENQISEKVSVNIANLPIQLLTRMTKLLVLKDSIKIDIRIIDNKSNILSNKEVSFFSPKSKVLTRVELEYDNTTFGISAIDLTDDDYNSMYLDYYRFNKIFLNKIKGFKFKIKLETPRKNLSFGIQLPFKYLFDYKFWLEDKSGKKINLIVQDLSEECRNFNFKVLTIPESVPLNRSIDLVFEDLETGILYSFKILN